MSDRTELDFQIAVLDTLSALVSEIVAESDATRAGQMIERLRVLKEERVRALREWYPESDSSGHAPPA
jgi:hypothetical protein